MAACRFFFSMGFDRELRRRITSERFDRETLACQTEALRWAKRIARWTDDVVELHGGFFYEKGDAALAIGHAWIEVGGEIFDPTAEQFDGDVDESYYDTHEIVDIEP